MRHKKGDNLWPYDVFANTRCLQMEEKKARPTKNRGMIGKKSWTAEAPGPVRSAPALPLILLNNVRVVFFPLVN